MDYTISVIWESCEATKHLLEGCYPKKGSMNKRKSHVSARFRTPMLERTGKDWVGRPEGHTEG